jgi:hypothetical protein
MFLLRCHAFLDINMVEICNFLCRCFVNVYILLVYINFDHLRAHVKDVFRDRVLSFQLSR